MKADCHMHMVLDGVDWKRAVGRHLPMPDDGFIRAVLGVYRDLGYTYLRDGGDKWNVSGRARELAPEYGIVYRTPLAPISMAGHYGGFIGKQVADLKQYAGAVKAHRQNGAEFIKIMISGLMDFDRFGVLSEPGLDAKVIGEMIHIAHAEGFSVMAHANGADTVIAAAQAGVESIEHGAYLNKDALAAMKENGVVWVPTLSTIGNLIIPPAASQPPPFRQGGLGAADPSASLRSAQDDRRGTDSSQSEIAQDDRKVGAAAEILAAAMENVAKFAHMGGLVAPGTDAGAFNVPHGCATEEGYLRDAGVTDVQMEQGIKAVRERF